MKTEIKDLKKELDKVKGDLKKDIGTLKEQITSTGQKLVNTEKYVEDLNFKILKVTSDQQQIEVMTQYRATENFLRFRGILEEDGEDIRKKMIIILGEFLEMEVEDVIPRGDLIYRVRSTYAEKKGLPRDVIVQLTTRWMKEEILSKHFKNPMEVLKKK